MSLLVDLEPLNGIDKSLGIKFSALCAGHLSLTTSVVNPIPDTLDILDSGTDRPVDVPVEATGENCASF